MPWGTLALLRRERRITKGGSVFGKHYLYEAAP
jgi:hypothetical protein